MGTYCVTCDGKRILRAFRVRRASFIELHTTISTKNLATFCSVHWPLSFIVSFLICKCSPVQAVVLLFAVHFRIQHVVGMPEIMITIDFQRYLLTIVVVAAAAAVPKSERFLVFCMRFEIILIAYLSVAHGPEGTMP